MLRRYRSFVSSLLIALLCVAGLASCGATLTAYSVQGIYVYQPESFFDAVALPVTETYPLCAAIWPGARG